MKALRRFVLPRGFVLFELSEAFAERFMCIGDEQEGCWIYFLDDALEAGDLASTEHAKEHFPFLA